jgi:AI-2E family transporter
VALSIVVAALVLWKIRIVLALLFLGFVIASAMRPSVEWLNRRARVPRSVGVVAHYLGFLAAIALFLYLVVPVAITQIDHAIGLLPLIAIPVASIAATLVDVVVRNRDPAEQDTPAVLFAAAGKRLARSGLAPASEDEPTERETEPEGADGEGADRSCFPGGRKALPAAQRLPFLVCQLLAAPLLAQGLAGPQAEVDVIEDLGRFFGHDLNL